MSQNHRSALADVTNQIVNKRELLSDNTSNFHSAKKQCIGPHFTKQITGEFVLRPHEKADNIVSEPVKKPEEGEDGKSSGSEGIMVITEKKGEIGNLGVNDEENDVSVGDLESSKDEFLDVSRFPESQESICGLEKCIGQKGGDGSSSLSVDLIKSCPCSFCTKAAYIWSDLHYQDMKGRIAAVKKSQKEAFILAHQNSRDVAAGRYGQGNFGNYSNLESDLSGRWKSLFLHMQDIFVHESNQLETNLSTLKELRDDCKTDLERQ
uniref:uncharacterized protein LOC122590225 n=1 Tax=Erigeron canadensis TaxID=72917 RepID=UPI001CB97D39|nr:uncharacterized protein LOC122590225 [Erigeron canadensis]